MKTQINIIKLCALLMFFFTFSKEGQAQQDPQYTQYMYNTMSVNPGYAGSRGIFSVTGLHRSQWVGITGAPQTQTLGIESPVTDKVGLGFNIVNDKLGPSQEVYLDGNFSYSIPTTLHSNLYFGLKAGLRFLDVDFSKGTASQQNDPNLENINSKFLPTVGLGVYYDFDSRWYVGLSVPNLLTTKHYDRFEQAVAKERLHVYLIGGYVFDINRNIQFKPAVLAKAVSGSPLSVDGSANFLFNNTLTLGVGYRWGDSVGALAGFQVNEGLFIGYAYDYTTSGLNAVTSGSHEIMLRFDLVNPGRIKSPRFF
ncbi:PorP/SprF family type IX secretion system membrane protein [Algibacter pacificus]|uniref:PorP/SprF family type IX secretion system membrane protein n=1 Tax=Algibacter pacificus TaxID=2599389 RepID=UPI0011CAB433|nr:type IX secretion system membrane protein PorP/SprF [Algibacter pacificus]